MENAAPVGGPAHRVVAQAQLDPLGACVHEMQEAQDLAVGRQHMEDASLAAQLAKAPGDI